MTEANDLNRLLQILLIEDCPGDVLLTKEALEDSTLHIQLNHVDTGFKAVDFLHRQGQYADAQEPDLILLDLNLPGKSGRDILKDLKQDKSLKRIPVVILTSSEDEKDIQDAYDFGANCYISKPIDLDEFSRIISFLEVFWFTLVKLPTKSISYK